MVEHPSHSHTKNKTKEIRGDIAQSELTLEL